MLGVMEKQRKRRNRLKYTIAGFNQIEAVKMGLSVEDLTVLRWFIDYKNSNAITRIYIEKINDIAFELDYKILIDELPVLLLDIENVDRILAGSLSQILKLKEENDKKYIYIDRDNYSKLISSQNIDRNEDN
ncbi:MAG: hypothetical protein ACRDB9_07605 [Cetobacterium sp.]